MITEIKLVDGDDELVLLPNDGVRTAELDAGFPEIREVTEDRTDDDGTRDTTLYHGASAVSISMVIFDQPFVLSARALLDQITRFCRPGARPYLVVSDTNWLFGPRRIQLRADQRSAPFVGGRDAAGVMNVQCQWKAPLGIWESVEPRLAWIAGDNPEPVFTRETADAFPGGAHTTTRLVAFEADAVGFLVNGDMYLYDSVGVLKESTRFQVTAMSSGFGLTNIDFSPPASVAVVDGDQLRQDPGLTYPKIYPKYYSPRQGVGGQIINPLNEGTHDCHFTARLYGPCKGPRLTNDTTGESIEFLSSLEIVAGEYLEIDTRNRTALYLSSAGSSRLNYMDYTTSRWWRLRPGPNEVRYNPAGGPVTSATQAVIEYRPAYL